MKKPVLATLSALVLLLLCGPVHAEPISSAISAIASYVSSAVAAAGGWAAVAAVGPAVGGIFRRGKR